MLKKILNSESKDKLWFCDNVFDVIIWINEDLTPRGFQICYDIDESEKAVSFHDGKFHFDNVDSGTCDPNFNHSPILTTQTAADIKYIIDEIKPRMEFMEKIYGEYIISNLKINLK